MSDITEIKRGLAQRAQDVAEMLLPRGKKEGHEWRAGSVLGEPGSSLGVHLTGNKAGLWRDFASDGERSGGDLIDLWVATSGLPLRDVLDKARAYLGMSVPEPYRPAKKTFKRPSRPKCRRPESTVLDYLREVRNLSPEAIAAYKIGEQRDKIIFPYLSPDGELLLAKARAVGDSQPCKPTSSEAQPCLFGWQAVDPNARTCVIVEGEIDAPSLWQYGRPALSVPFGGGGGAKQQWIEHEFENLAQFETIYLALDDDNVGDEACAEIANRLGRHRCLRVRLPRKDANQCLVDGVPREEIDAAFESAKSLDPDGLGLPSDYADKVVELFWPEDGVEPGYMMPYSKLGRHVLIRPGELSVWSGYTGDGKSQILSDCIVDWINQGARVCVASYEMPPERTLKRMAKQATGMDRPAEKYIRSTMSWLDKGLVLYGKVGRGDCKETLEVFEYARRKYGCTVFVIDSLLRMGVALDDYSGQEEIAYNITDWSYKNNVHTHLVAHSRKPGDSSRQMQNEHDVKGASGITDNAANVFIVWRDRKKEDRIVQLKGGNEEREEGELQKLLDTPLVWLSIPKQRHGDWTGKCGLWFSKITYRYDDNPKARDRNYPIPDVAKHRPSRDVDGSAEVSSEEDGEGADEGGVPF